MMRRKKSNQNELLINGWKGKFALACIHLLTFSTFRVLTHVTYVPLMCKISPLFLFFSHSRPPCPAYIFAELLFKGQREKMWKKCEMLPYVKRTSVGCTTKNIIGVCKPSNVTL